MKCKNCGAEVDCCQNINCINNLHKSGSFKDGDEIFCEDGNHYCERDCLVEEFKECGINGDTTIVTDK